MSTPCAVQKPYQGERTEAEQGLRTRDTFRPSRHLFREKQAGSDGGKNEQPREENLEIENLRRAAAPKGFLLGRKHGGHRGDRHPSRRRRRSGRWQRRGNARSRHKLGNLIERTPFARIVGFSRAARGNFPREHHASRLLDGVGTQLLAIVLDADAFCHKISSRALVSARVLELLKQVCAIRFVAELNRQ